MTYTVGELIKIFQRLDPSTKVGVAFSNINGHVHGIVGIKYDEHGVLIMDLEEETFYPDEVKIE